MEPHNHGRLYSKSGHTHNDIDHDDLTNVTADQHHAKSHVHLADGSGTVAHSSLSGIGANDHHSQAHTLSGVDHSGNLAQSRTHDSPDTDSATSSLHHTIGSSSTQAAAGNHNHTTTYAPIAAKYIVQTADSDLTAEQALGALATGILKNTTTTGVLSIAAGSDLPSHNHAASDVNSGTLALARGGTNADNSSQAQNLVWASPDGSTGAVSYRAIVAADLPATGTVKLIQTQTLGSAAATITFSSIPGTYSHLLLIVAGQTSAAVNSTPLRIVINSDTGANYDDTFLGTTGVASFTFEQLAASLLTVGSLPGTSAPANAVGSAAIWFPNYSGTAFHKSATDLAGRRETNASAGTVFEHFWGSWRSTAAITNLQLSLTSGNFVTSTQASLYGLG